MKLTILGSGSSVPDGRRAGAGFWVQTPHVRMIMDCGPGVLPNLARHVQTWTSLTHVVLSHLHVDHVIELPALLFALRHALRDGPGREAPLIILGPEGTTRLVEGLEDLLQTNLTDPGFEVRLSDVQPGLTADLAPGETVSFEKAPHTDESVAMRVDARGSSVGYTGDSGPSPHLGEFFRGCDVLLCDCSLPQPRPGVEHMSTAEAARTARQAGVSHLVATHLFPEQDETRVQQILRDGFAGTVTLARDGLTLDF